MKVILELGGNPAVRAPFAVNLLAETPDAHLIFSTDENPALCVQLLKDKGLFGSGRYTFDYRAWDTVSNFTATKELVMGYKPSELYVVTDGYHMPRAMAIATAVYSLSGVTITPKPASSGGNPEPQNLIEADKARAWGWRSTGQLLMDTSVYNPRMKQYQEYYYQMRKLTGG